MLIYQAKREDKNIKTNIKTLTATYLSVLNVKVSSFTATKLWLPAKRDIAYKWLRKDWKLNGKAWLLF